MRKDRILGEYITVYLPKIATQRRPILFVDGFAGPGRFEDGKAGSPLILANAIESARPRLRVDARLLCVEEVNSLAEDLERNLVAFDFAEVKHGRFSAAVPEIESAARSHSVFLYIDPFTVEGLCWDELDQVFQHLHRSRMSVEVLINFNAASFVRRGLAALRYTIPPPDPKEEGVEEIDAPFDYEASISHLDTVLGTADWQNLLGLEIPFKEKVERVNSILIDRLQTRFREVCFHPMLAYPHHTVPKYYLVFASRSHHGLRLMNDAMVKSQETLADMAKPTDATLFEMRSERLVPDKERLPGLILEHTSTPTRREDVMIAIIRREFGQFSWKDIRGAVENLLKNNQLRSETGKTRINDNVRIWRVR